MIDSKSIISDFPILSRTINGKRLVYLDNGATSQKPQIVIDALVKYYQTSNANVHRGVHTLSDESTRSWEESRTIIAEFFGADPEELIITRNTTEALNGIAYGWADHNLKQGNVVLTTMMEHHADIVPWQEACKRTDASLEFINVDENGRLDLAHFEALLKQHAQNLKLIAVTHISNVLGTVLPLQKIVALLKKHYPEEVTRPRLVVDGAQSAPHLPLNFKTMGVDFFAFSGHKMLAPMGVGGLLVRKKILETEELKPWFFGGGMIAEVSKEKTIFNEHVSERFTPGTPDVGSTVGLAAACTYLNKLGMQNLYQHDKELVSDALEKLTTIPEVAIIGPQKPLAGETVLDRVGSVAFIYTGVHAHDVAQILDSEGVAVRSGHHCTMPLHNQYNWQATVRVSFQVYNSKEDIDALITALAKVKQIFKK